MARVKTIVVFRVVTAAVLVLGLTVLSDYCRYVVQHHPHRWDLVVAACAGTRGLIFGVYMMGMARLLELFGPRAWRIG